MIGASVAYHLAARGVRDVLVLERAADIGAGSTGRATGGIRVQFSNPVDIRLSQLSQAKLARFADETGGDCGFSPAGYLWLARNTSELDTLHAALAVQEANGVTNARRVTLDDIAEINPAVALDEVVGGTFCPTDGFIRPLQILAGYRAAAERLGVRFQFNTNVIGCTVASERITHVHTATEAIAADVVVNAAGAWAAQIARFAGADLPVVPLRRQVALTEPTGVLPATMPMTNFHGDGFHLRVREGRVLLLMATPGAADPFDDRIEPGWIEMVTAIAHRRIPALRHVAIDRAGSWAGLYEQSPDGHAIVGFAPEIANLYYVNGSSGHGVMHSPALGQLASEEITGAALSLDIAALRPDRFNEPVHNARELL